MSQVECPPSNGIHVRKPEVGKSMIDPKFIAATTVIGDKVVGSNNKELGKIEEIILDLTSGTLIYAVLSVGGFFGVGDKLFAVPLDQLTFDTEEKVFFLDVSKNYLKKLPGFDKDNWPEKAEWPIKR